MVTGVDPSVFRDGSEFADGGPDEVTVADDVGIIAAPNRSHRYLVHDLGPLSRHAINHSGGSMSVGRFGQPFHSKIQSAGGMDQAADAFSLKPKGRNRSA